MITVYQQDTFTDLCRGPHVENTGDLDPKAFKITQVTGFVLARRREQQDAQAVPRHRVGHRRRT